MTNAIKEIANFVYQTNFNNLEYSIIESAKKCILDLIGVTILGSKHTIIDILVDNYVNKYFPVNQASIIQKGKKTTIQMAAFINAAMGHILDFDDIKLNIGHPSVTIIPAILSIGEFFDSSGAEVLTACVIGIEVSSKIANWLEPEQSKFGWHQTCTSGIFGATAAAGKLLKLDKKALYNALGLAAIFASGLKRSKGTLAKSVQVGQTAKNAVDAALFGEIGITSDSSIFHGKLNFAQAISKKNIEKYDLQTFGKSFEIMDVGFKCYPSCASTHTAIDAILLLQKEESIEIDSINNIRVGTVPMILDSLVYNMPNNPLEAKFSMQFCVAVAILEGAVLHEHFTQTVLEDPKIQYMMKKISMHHHADLKSLGYKGTQNSIVEIEFKDGSRRISRVDIPRGHPKNPVSINELINKYKYCTKGILTEKNQAESIEIILGLDYEKNIKCLMHSISTRI